MFEQQLDNVTRVRAICFSRNSKNFVAMAEMHDGPSTCYSAWYFQNIGSSWVPQGHGTDTDDVGPFNPKLKPRRLQTDFFGAGFIS